MPETMIPPSELRHIREELENADREYQKKLEEFEKPDRDSDNAKLELEVEWMAKKIGTGEDPESVRNEVENAHDAMDYIESLPNPELTGLLEGLAGIDLPKAWEIRIYALKQFSHDERVIKSVLHSLAGSYDPRAWPIRNEFINTHPNWVAVSLVGLDTPEAWQARKRLTGENLLVSIAGLDTPEANVIRKEHADHQDQLQTNGFAFSLIGIDSTFADTYREKLWGHLNNTALKGIDNSKSKSLREKIIKPKSLKYQEMQLQSLAGTDTKWDVREDILTHMERQKPKSLGIGEGQVYYRPYEILPDLISSVNGVINNRATKFRERIKVLIENSFPPQERSYYTGLLAKSAFGGPEGVAIRKARSYKKSGR